LSPAERPLDPGNNQNAEDSSHPSTVSRPALGSYSTHANSRESSQPGQVTLQSSFRRSRKVVWRRRRRELRKSSIIGLNAGRPQNTKESHRRGFLIPSGGGGGPHADGHITEERPWPTIVLREPQKKTQRRKEAGLVTGATRLLRMRAVPKT